MSENKSVNQRHSASNKRKKRTARQKAIIILSVTLCVLVTGIFSFAGYYLFKINITSLDKFTLSETLPSDEIDPTIDLTIPEDPNPSDMQFGSGDIIYSRGIQNILLIGSDSRGGSGYGRSDSMILVSIDKKSHRLIMTSFLRDLYVKIAGIKDNRINTAYRYGGPKLLIETIQNNFRVRIDQYVRIDFQCFRDIIDEIGGIEINLTSSEADELNSPGNYEELGKIQRVSAGVNTLNGVTALAYSRIRHIDSDFSRTQRQRNVMQAVFAKLKNSGASTILAIADRFLPEIQTNLTYGQITGLVLEASALMNYPISQLSIPVKGGYSNRRIRSMAVLVPDIEKNKAALWALIYQR
jgi:LCP family protein required for cell wall assembly